MTFVFLDVVAHLKVKDYLLNDIVCNGWKTQMFCDWYSSGNCTEVFKSLEEKNEN